jgi:PIN domain nuclease of toxin-antitoxin system
MTLWLLDTHVLIWALSEPSRLDPGTVALIRSPAEEVLFSSASIWEIAIKAARRRVDFAVDADEIARTARRTGLDELPVWSSAAGRVAQLRTRRPSTFQPVY